MSSTPRRRVLSLAAAAVSVAGLTTAALPSAAAAPASAPAPAVVPKPVTTLTGHGTFRLTRNAHIVATGGARRVAAQLAAYLAPATGYRLPIRGGAVHKGDIELLLADPGTLGSDPLHEGYQLSVAKNHVTLVAPRAHGLFDGVQTIRQLLPGRITSRTQQSGPWTMPAVSITDYPRYGYRGLMLDIARHYRTPGQVKKLVDIASSYKINTLHIHLSDDQGFRVVVKGFPRLTAIGAQGAGGTQGRPRDPGGYWTQAEYRRVVASPRSHFMSVAPEVDSPSHNNAI